MMRPKDYVYTTSGKQAPIPLDMYVNGYGLAVTTNTGTGHYTLQYSMLNPWATYTNSYTVSGRWFDWDDPLLVNASTNRSTNLAFPARAVRVYVSSQCSAGNPLTLSITPMGAL